ncbi:hypothetical protein KAR91_38665 [Candidatus Pacearchaeota archaeon]|nr:hypothetical protein [Candidatus Pacearchaeota archaeon]
MGSPRSYPSLELGMKAFMTNMQTGWREERLALQASPKQIRLLDRIHDEVFYLREVIDDGA